MRRQRLLFEGSASVLSDGRALSNPGAALRSAPTEHTTITLSVTGAGTSFGTTGESRSDALEDTLALGHFEQFTRVIGEITVGGRTFGVDGGDCVTIRGARAIGPDRSTTGG